MSPSNPQIVLQLMMGTRALLRHSIVCVKEDRRSSEVRLNSADTTLDLDSVARRETDKKLERETTSSKMRNCSHAPIFASWPKGRFG